MKEIAEARSLARLPTEASGAPDWFSLRLPARPDPIAALTKLASSPEAWQSRWESLEQEATRTKEATEQLRDVLLAMPDPAPQHVELGHLLEQRLQAKRTD